MIGSMADLLLLVFSIAIILILFTAFDNYFALPLLSPSRYEARELLVAIQDLLLPMGSFPSNLLHPWASKVKTCRSTDDALPSSSKATHAEDMSKPALVPRSIELISDDSVSKPIAMPASIETPPSESGSKTIAMPPPTKQTAVDAGLKNTTVSPCAEFIPDDGQPVGSEDYLDASFFDALEYQLESENDTQIAKSISEMLLPEHEAAEVDSLGSTSNAVEEKQQEEESTAAAEKILMESRAFESAIRELVDPDGRYSPDTPGTIELVATMTKRQTEAVESLRSETVRFERAEEDLRHGWEDKKAVFERVIRGQNTRLHLTQQENDELLENNETLRGENAASKAKYERMKERYNRNLETLITAKEWAEHVAETATTTVEGRIDALKEKHKQENSATEHNNRQEQNTLICRRRMVEDSLADARLQVAVGEQQHKSAMEDKNGIIRELNATVRQLRSTVATSQELTAFAKRDLKTQLHDQRRENDRQMETLRSQLHESKDDAKALRGWKATAEREQRHSQQLSNRLEEETTTLRENKNHIVERLKLDIRGLKRTITMNDATIAELRRSIMAWESGQEVKDLKSQYLEAQKRIRQSTNEKQGLQRRLKSLEMDISGLKRTVEDKDREIRENREKWAGEKGTLEQALQQANSVSNRDTQRKIGKLEEEKQELLHQLGTAHSNEQRIHTQVKELEGEKTRSAEQLQNMTNEKDRKIQGLEQTIVDASLRFDRRVEEEVGRQLQVAIEAKEVQVRDEAEREYGRRKLENDPEREKAVRDATEEANKTIQAKWDSERMTYLGKMNEATETENNLRNEIRVLKSQPDGSANAAQSMSISKADLEPPDNAKELISLARELDEALDLFEEIEERGILKMCGERILLRELNEAKKALSSVKREVQQPKPDQNDLLYIMSEATIDEGRFQQCDPRKRPVLIRQARAANETLQSLQKVLRTNPEVQKDAVLEILRSPTKNETKALPDENRAQDRSVDSAVALAHQGEGDFKMGEASDMQNTAMPEAPETGMPRRSLAEILATLQRMAPVSSEQAAQQDRAPQQETGAKPQGFATPNQNESVNQLPLPGLFQSQSANQVPLPGWLLPQSVKTFPRARPFQLQGEIKMPRGFTRLMRQWAKGWVRNGDITRAEMLLLEKFKPLQTYAVDGLRGYLVQLQQQVAGQTLDQMEQPGGWTDGMTLSVEVGLQSGKEKNTIIKYIKKNASYPEDMEGVEMYVEKLTQEYNTKPETRAQPAQKPADWTDDMTVTVIDQLRKDFDTGFEEFEKVLKEVDDFETDDTKGLQRYLEKLKQHFQDEAEDDMQHN